MDDRELVDVLTMDAIKRCFKLWGVEATEDKIYELCYTKEMLDCFLRNYKRLIENDKR